MWQPTSGFSLPASFALLAFHFQLFTSGFSLELFVLCLKRRTASLPTLASKGNPFSAPLLTNSLMTSKMTVSVMAARVSKGAGYQHAGGNAGSFALISCDDLAEKMARQSAAYVQSKHDRGTSKAGYNPLVSKTDED